MILRLRAFLFLLAILTGYRAQAQVYEPGLLVRANGDTLRGEIQNGFWDVPPAFIRYRPTATGASTLFQPRQLRAVQFTGGRYFSYEALPIDHAAITELALLPRGNPSNIQVDSLLAEVLVAGPTTLWRVARPGSVHLLVRRPGQPVLDMAERQFLRQDDQGSWVIAEGNNYRSQLSQYFGDCPAALAVAEKASFTSAAIASVVRAYYAACTAGQAAPRSYLKAASFRRRAAFQAGVLAGVRYNRIESYSTDQAGPCTDCGVHPFGGFYAELLQPSRVSAIYGELTLSSFASRGALAVYNTTSGTRTYGYYSYRALLGTARIGARLLVPLRHDQQLVFSLGLEHNEVFSPTVTLTGGPVVQPGSDDLPFAHPTLLPNAGVGWRRQRLTLSFDGQLYATDGGSHSGVIRFFFDSGVAARLGVSYRLGHAADARSTTRPTLP